MKVIIIDKSDEIIRTCLIEEDDLVEEYEEGANITRLAGNVYLGKVRNILPQSGRYCPRHAPRGNIVRGKGE